MISCKLENGERDWEIGRFRFETERLRDYEKRRDWEIERLGDWGK